MVFRAVNLIASSFKLFDQRVLQTLKVSPRIKIIKTRSQMLAKKQKFEKTMHDLQNLRAKSRLSKITVQIWTMIW